LIDFCGPGSIIKELERNLLIDDRVLRYLTVLTNKSFDISSLEREEEEKGLKKEEEMTEEVPEADDNIDIEDKDSEIEKNEEESEDAD